MKKIILFIAVAMLPAMLGAQDLTDVKCLMKPDAPAKAETAVDYNGGKVYFCCNNCAKKFQTDNEPFVAMANHQMYVTGQIQQKACPITGKPVADGVSCEVGGIDVGVCCKSCQAKVNGAKDLAAKSTIVFSAVAMEKGFEAAPAKPDLTGVMCMMMPDHEVVADSFAEYRGGKVFFCCDKCAKGFAKDPSKAAIKANMQLVQTGQFVQTACPITGNPVADGVTAKIGEMEIGVCCAKCQAKVNAAADDAARAELVFGDESFEKGFAAVTEDK